MYVKATNKTMLDFCKPVELIFSIFSLFSKQDEMSVFCFEGNIRECSIDYIQCNKLFNFFFRNNCGRKGFWRVYIFCFLDE